MFIVFFVSFQNDNRQPFCFGRNRNVFVFMVVAMFCCVNRKGDGLSWKVLSSS